MIKGNDLSQTKRIKVCIVDDDNAYVEAMKEVLSFEPRIWLYGNYSSGYSFLQSLNSPFKADTFLIDICLKDMSGLNCAKEVKKLNPNAHVILITSQHDNKILSEATLIGVDYIEKGTRGEMLINSIITNSNNFKKEQFFSLQSSNEDLNYSKVISLMEDIFSVNQRLTMLSSSQTKVLMLKRKGKTINEISSILGIKPETVRTHMKRALKKLNLPNIWSCINVKNLNQNITKC
ncbi:MAG: response regulator transcription factor [Spirochaetota bacterium]|nr:response regulator transcription factor [Spirochaetota bacterium]